MFGQNFEKYQEPVEAEAAVEEESAPATPAATENGNKENVANNDDPTKIVKKVDLFIFIHCETITFLNTNL